MNGTRQRRGGMIKALVILVFIVIVINTILDLDIFRSNPPVPTTAVVPERAAPVANGYGTRPLENSWPKLETEAPGVLPAENLLAENFYVLLDGSGSMNDSGCSAGLSKIRAAMRALQGFLSHVPPEANFGLAVFNGGQAGELLPLQPAGQINLDRFNLSPEGSTPLALGVRLGYERLSEQGRKQLGYGRYHLIVITDGMASKGQDPTRMLEQVLQESPVSVHTIGFCIGNEHSLNQPGRTVYHAADDPASLSKGLDSVLAEAPQFDLGQFE